MTHDTDPTAPTTFDLVALGEVMLRLDPKDVRIRAARTFDVYEGGGEYNVARAVRTSFGRRSAIVTALVDDEVGRLVEDLILTSGVSTRLVTWRPAGDGRRTGLNFTERGHGTRGAVGVSDRACTAAAELAPADVDWDELFGSGRVGWFHTGGVFAGLSPTTTATALAAIAAANRAGVPVSFDTNYRPSLWRTRGGRSEATAVFSHLAAGADVLLGSAWDLFPDSPPFEDDFDRACTAFAAGVARIRERCPRLGVVATTHRTVRSASHNTWGAMAWGNDCGHVAIPPEGELEIYDRVGGGDGFAAGLAVGLLDGKSLDSALRQGLAHGALAMTTPGDTSRAGARDVRALAGHQAPRMQW